jgi:hypothetical protein
MSFWTALPDILKALAGFRRPAPSPAEPIITDATAAREGPIAGEAQRRASNQRFSRTYPLSGASPTLPVDGGVIKCRGWANGEWYLLEWSNGRWRDATTDVTTSGLPWFFTHWMRVE